MGNELRGGSVNHGERIAALERDMRHAVERIDHIDERIDEVDGKVEKNAAVHREYVRVWDKRWWIGLGIIGTLIFASGGGSLSLKNILDIISHLKP